MAKWSLVPKDTAVIGNGLKGLSIGLLCIVYFFGKDNLDKLFEAIALWIRMGDDPAVREQVLTLLVEASEISAMGLRMVESGYLIACVLILVSCTLFGIVDGLRERRVMELQNESEARARRLEEAQERLTEVQRRLAHAERLAAVGRMAAGVSHEINNPLAAISGHIRLLSMQLPESDERRPLLEVMQKEARRIRSIVKGLNDFARVQPKPEEIRKTTADVHDIINEALAAFQPMFAESKVRVNCQFGDDEAIVFGGKDYLRLAFNNLISNAIEAMPGGGELIIRTSRSVVSEYDMMALKGFVPASEKGQEGETRRVYGSESEFSQPLLLNEGDPVVRVDFVDTGTGMAPDLMEKMFEPFVTTKEVGYGLGLGLAITYSIIHNHGGYFDVRSKVGEGSQFTVVLAAAEGTAGRSSQLSSPLSVESQSS
jgi:signal transduction histidine kinase